MKHAVLPLAAVLGLGLIGAATVDGRDGKMSKELAGLKFTIPDDHLFEAQIFFLPPSKSGAFTFLLQAHDGSDQIPPNRILVERLDQFCSGDLSAMLAEDFAQMLPVACGLEKDAADDKPPYHKVADPKFPTFFSYVSLPANSGSERSKARQVASCFESASPEIPPYCTTMWAYGPLILTHRFSEDELSTLPLRKDRAIALLNSWKVG